MDLKHVYSDLEQCPLFKGLAASDIHSIAAISVEKNFGKKQLVFSEGDPAAGFYIIRSGKIKIFKLSAEGKEQILHIFSKGEPVGEVPVFTGGRFPAFAEALIPTQTLFFSQTRFRNLIQDNPAIALRLLGILARRLQHFTVMIDDISLKEVPARLARYLLHLSKLQNDTSEVRLDVSKTQLASLLGTIPETLSRTLARLNRHGLIQTRGTTIRFCNIRQLEELAWSGRLESGGPG